MASQKPPDTPADAAIAPETVNGPPIGQPLDDPVSKQGVPGLDEGIDEFRLPVKRMQVGPPEPTEDGQTSRDSDAQEDDQDFESARQSRAPSPIKESGLAGTENAEHVGKQEAISVAAPSNTGQDHEKSELRIGPAQEGDDGNTQSSSAPVAKPEAEAGNSPFPQNNETTQDGSASKVSKSSEGTVEDILQHSPTSQRMSIVDNLLSGGTTGGVSDFSHQALAPHKVEEEVTKEEEWQKMPAYARYDLYDDDGKLIAREAHDSEDEGDAYRGLGGAGKGYTKIQLDEDAQSATSMDDNTNYLFKPKGTDLNDEEDDQRDPLAQLQTTKELLTEGQRIAYVGIARLAMAKMVKEMDEIQRTKKTKKGLAVAIEHAKMWSQKMMVRLYMHMEISSSEQVMIEQLPEHGVEPGDLTPALMQNARVKNPMADEDAEKDSLAEPKVEGKRRTSTASKAESSTEDTAEDAAETASLPAYKEHEDNEMPEVRTPSQLGTSKKIDIDLRWTVLCDLFLVLIADSVYDARSRTLLEKVGESLEVSWLEICRFEKRVTDSLEMQEAANKETWDEADHMETRRKQALKRRYMMMGLATVGGSLVIGLSAGLLAPVIGAGLAAGFTTIGVAGTSGFLAGAGGTALITSGAVLTGGTIAVRASHRRMGAVRTFEYRPLHNNKRVNLIVTISGWMNGKVDDVRLPYSTIDPIMGDMYSLLWEPEMLQSMGDTINILATEALTQGLQQVLGSTILVALMASLQLPIVLTKLSYLIDNPWTVSMGRANAAGLILADSLIDRNLGVRPITLVGFSLGARVIFAALRELANRGAFGLIQNVYLFGSPIVADREEYLRVRAVVSGRFVNGYASNDWILGYLFRATSGGIWRVAGLAPIENVHGLENIDVTKLVNGHMAYRAAMPKLMREVGWAVESDEFTEIEDPDPENHDKRQRELIKELDDARKEAEAKPQKKRFGFFKKGKLAEKKRWETYDDSMRKDDDWGTTNAEGLGNVLFDIEAIKAELASEQIEVKQLESTLPPIKLSVNDFKADETNPSFSPPKPHPNLNPYANLRGTKSYDGTSDIPFQPRNLDLEFASQTSLPNGHKPNPFNQGYDDYNLSAEAVGLHSSPGPSAEQSSKLSFEHPNQAVQNGASSSSNKISFESSSHSHPTSSPRPSSTFARELSPLKLPSSPLKEGIEHSSPYAPPARPPLRTTVTMPSANASASPPAPVPATLEHNAWADEEDEEFGEEQEVKLSF